MTEFVQIGRLALRHEGESWNAYYALNDTMEGAIPLGSIRMAAVTNNPPRKQAFMELMRDIVSEIVQNKTGVTPEWKEPVPGPDNERSGHA
jgi:hypothetical protein